MPDTTAVPSPAVPDPGSPTTGHGLVVVFADADAATVQPVIEALRAQGFIIGLVSEADPAVWGREPEVVLAEYPPGDYPAALAFLSVNFSASGFCGRVLEALARPAESAPHRLVLPVRLDGSPLPPPFDRTASVDLRQLTPETFTDKVREAVSRWLRSGASINPPVTPADQPGYGPWFRAAFVLGLETDHRTQEGLRALAETLPEADRELFGMKFLTGLDDRQIATRINIPREMVPIRVDRVLQRLREKFPRVY